MKYFNYLIIILSVFIISILLYGCGGSDSSLSLVNNPVAGPDQTGKTGTFTIKFSVPSFVGVESNELTGSVVPYHSTHLWVKIEGEAISSPITDGKALTAGYTEFTISNVPVGLNTATIEIRTSANGGGELLAQRKHGFFMPSGGSASVGTSSEPLSMGVAISGGQCVPQNIDVPLNTTLYFENRDTAQRIITTNPSSINATIPGATSSGQPNVPANYSAKSYKFENAGTYDYRIDGSPVSGRVLVYNLPIITKINPPYDSNNGNTDVSFTVEGTGFGTDRAMVNGEVNFYKMNYEWDSVGNAGFSSASADNSSLYVYNETPYIAFRDGANGNRATVMKYNGTAWETVGSAGFSPGEAQYISLYVYNNIPYVAFRDVANSGMVSLMKYNGTAWENVGTPDFSGAGSTFWTSLYIDSNGTPYVAYKDGNYSWKAVVMKFNGVSWEFVGSPGFSDGEAQYPSLQVYNGIPYVVFGDGTRSNRATVMKYNGTAWENVGLAGFSSASAEYTSFYVYNGVFFIAFKDGASSNKATVMRFNGSSWEIVGSPGISAGEVYWTSLEVYNGVPYVAFQDGGDSWKVIVMKFNGTSWEKVGNSLSPGNWVSLSISKGNPYVLYRDDSHGMKATVMKASLKPIGSPFSGTGMTWGDQSISGTVNIPAGFFCIQVKVRDSNTMEAVYFQKGTGGYNVVVY